MKPKPKVALLTGGDSSEREIALKTGYAIYHALHDHLQLKVFDVASLAPADSGWVAGQPLRLNAALLSSEEQARISLWWEDLTAAGDANRVDWSQLSATLVSGNFDVVLPALHGGWGEDGTLQSLLEVARLPYVGSPPRASVLALDKQTCKAVAREAGLQAPRGFLISHLQGCVAVARRMLESDPPLRACVVKPNAGGSSVGTTLLPQLDEKVCGEQLPAAVAAALADGSDALVEEFISGTEVTCAVMGRGSAARTLPVVEIVPRQDLAFYDYQAKYAAGGSEHLIPPRLPAATLDSLREQALLIHRTLGCAGVARSDFLVTPDGVPYFLEINTLPGMTSTSLVPDAARADGLDFKALLLLLLDQAMG